MKPDLYTKIVLTVIAACLCAMVLRDVRMSLVPEAQAQGYGQAAQRAVDVNIVGIGGVKLVAGLDVDVTAAALPVRVAR